MMDAIEERLRSEFLPAILHGDDEHRAWLTEAVAAFLDGQPITKPRGSGSADTIVALKRKLEVAREALKFGEWLPIESAPKDGRVIMGWIGVTWFFTWHVEYPKISKTGSWPFAKTIKTDGFAGWCGIVPSEDGYSRLWLRGIPNQPTHWMPLPPPPNP